MAGSEVKFDRQGDGLARYDILNYQRLYNSSGYQYKVAFHLCMDKNFVCFNDFTLKLWYKIVILHITASFFYTLTIDIFNNFDENYRIGRIIKLS